MNYTKHIENAKKTKFGLWKLNFGLFRIIPFNKPHDIKLHKLTDNSIETIIPYKRKNFNHIKGIHACGLATCAEFASGFLLLTRLDSKKYRLIMKRIEMSYHYQAKSDVVARFELNDDWLTEQILKPLTIKDSIFIKCKIELYDKNDNHVATGITDWQVKDWKKVKTKM